MNIMYFSADWCAPCKATKPIVQEFIKDNPEPKVYIIDADQETDLVNKFQVRSIPTFILVDGEKELKRHIGSMTREQFYDFTKYEETVQDDV